MTAAATLLTSSPVPASLSRFIGRAREISAVSELLEQARLLTLTGAGGSGKTRLAAEVVGRISHRWDRVVWIDLAPATDAARVANRVAGGFGLTERTEAAALAGIRQLVGTQALLLVLDNCEHLIDTCAIVADELLRDLPGLSILATSREALGIRGETAWLVPPLPPVEAVALFMERARSAQPGFSAATPEAEAAIARICRRIDGIPLAIELAAARVRILSVEQIADRLGDALRLLSGGSRTALPRHRTLRSTIEWSVDMLSDGEQVLLRRLAAFPSSFSLEAAEAVAAGDQLDVGDILDALSGLVDRSLLVLDANDTDARYRLLEVVRQFAAERLAAAGEGDGLARRHAEHYLAVAEAAAPEIFGGGRPLIIARLAPDTPNFRAAIEWSAGSPDRFEIGLRYLWALQWFWWSRGAFEEVQHLRQVLPDLETADTLSPKARLRALIAICMMGCWQGRLDDALQSAGAVIRLLDPDEDLELTAIAFTMVASARTLTGDIAGAVEYLERAVPLGRDHSRSVISVIALHFLGVCRLSQGDLEGAWDLHTSQAEAQSRLGYDIGRTHARAGQAGIRYLQGRVDEAAALFRDALLIAHEGTDFWGIAKGVEGVAICLAPADPDTAARLLGAAESHRERIAHPQWLDEIARYQTCVAGLRATLGDRFDAIWASGRSLTAAEAAAEALRATAAERTPLAGTAAAAGDVADLVVRSLGPLEVVCRGEPITPAAWGSARPRELLVFLLCHPAGVTKEAVGAALWPDASPTQLRNNFHVTLHRLRKALGAGDWIQATADIYRVDPGLSVDFDAVRFEQETRTGLGALKRRDPAGAHSLASALARYRGPFLEHEPAADWAADHRDRLARIHVDGGLGYGRWLTDAGRHEEAESILRGVTAKDPLSEDACGALMTALGRMGDRIRALQSYRQLETVLAGEFGTSPGAAILDLRDRIERGESF